MFTTMLLTQPNLAFPPRLNQTHSLRFILSYPIPGTEYRDNNGTEEI